MNKCLIRKEKSGISTSLSFISLAIIILVIGSIVAYFYIYHLKLTTQVETSELAKQETRLLERLSLVYWGGGTAILSNDGEISISIKKIYVDNNIIPINPSIVINPHEKKEIPIPSGQSLMVETSSGNLIKLVEKGFTLTAITTWTTNLPSEITYTSYVPTTITTTQTSISLTTITTTTPITYTTTIPITQTQTLSTTQTLTSYIPTTYTTTGTATITTTIPTTITTTKSTTQTITSYVPTTYTSVITTIQPTTITQTQTLTQTITKTVIRTTITSSYLTTTTIPAIPTAHFRGDTWTINGLNAYKLDSSQSNIEKSNYVTTTDLAPTAFWINVWKRSSSGSETLIAGGYTARVFIYYNSKEGYYSASWSHSAISLNPSDSIVVRVYGYDEWSKSKCLATFTTSQLGITYIPASTWTVYYYIRIRNYFLIRQWYTNYYFYWGISSKDSRIENFIPTPITTTTYVPTTITTITDYLGSIFIGENSPAFLITLCIIVVSITIEIKERIKNGKYEK